MSPRRPPGEGSIRKRADGRWEWALAIGHTATGGAQRVHVYARTRKALMEKVDRKREELAAGHLVLPDAMTVAGFAERWLEARARGCKPNTVASYRHALERFVLPGLGAMRLQRLTPMTLHRWVEQVTAMTVSVTRRDGDKLVTSTRPLSVRSVRYAHAVLDMALRQAVAWRLLRENPLEAVEPPPAVERAATVWNPDEVRAFLAAATTSRLYVAYLLALTCGLRRGEVLGLRASDADLTAKTLAIRRTVIVVGGVPTEGAPKTAKGRRILHLSQEAVTALRLHLEHVAEVRRSGLLAGIWRGGDDPWICTTAHGTPIAPRNLARDFLAVIGRAGVPRIRLHDLRHTYGSLAIAHVPLPALSARMGHHRPSYTADVYAHEVPGAGKDSALDLEELLGEGKAN